MGIDIHWWNRTQTALHIQFHDDWLWQHVLVCADQIYRLLETTSAPLTLVVNLLHNTQCPPGGLAQHVPLLKPIHHHENTAQVVFLLPAGSSLKPLLESITQFHGSPYCTYTFSHSLNTIEQLLGECRTS